MNDKRLNVNHFCRITENMDVIIIIIKKKTYFYPIELDHTDVLFLMFKTCVQALRHQLFVLTTRFLGCFVRRITHRRSFFYCPTIPTVRLLSLRHIVESVRNALVLFMFKWIVVVVLFAVSGCIIHTPRNLIEPR